MQRQVSQGSGYGSAPPSPKRSNGHRNNFSGLTPLLLQEALDTMFDGGMDEKAATSPRCCSRQTSCASPLPRHCTSRQTSQRSVRSPSPRNACSRQSSLGASHNRSVSVEKRLPLGGPQIRSVSVEKRNAVSEDCDAQKTMAESTSTDSISTASTVHEVLPAILLDWDDTLCPTTWLKEDCDADWMKPLSQSLNPGARTDAILNLVDSHTTRLQEFLIEASKLGPIIIVTLAKKPWVEIAIQNWMPALAETMRDCEVEVIYAQDYASDDIAMCLDENEVEEICTGAKASAIVERLLEAEENFTNFISIGDSHYEIDGMHQAREDLVKSGRDAHQCRTSTLKLLDEPTVEELTAELELLQKWLPYLAKRTTDFDGEIDSPDDRQLQELHLKITGKTDDTLCWENLVGDLAMDARAE